MYWASSVDNPEAECRTGVSGFSGGWIWNGGVPGGEQWNWCWGVVQGEGTLQKGMLLHLSQAAGGGVGGAFG